MKISPDLSGLPIIDQDFTGSTTSAPHFGHLAKIHHYGVNRWRILFVNYYVGDALLMHWIADHCAEVVCYQHVLLFSKIMIGVNEQYMDV